VMIDVASKFFLSVCFQGWFANTEGLRSVRIVGGGLVGGKCEIKPAPPSFDASYQSWKVQCLTDSDCFPTDASLVFETGAGMEVSFGVIELLRERETSNPSVALEDKFFGRLAAGSYDRVLDVGGRDRSLVGDSPFNSASQVTIFDIVEQEGVNVVGDAHELSKFFPPDTFDAVHCRSVLEHIAMPWKMAVEVAAVLRVGGIGLFHTHQTVGMHDIPWDFWRFSDTAWDALFNPYTGFRIIDRALSQECFVIPFRWRPGVEFERAAGFEISSVLVEKIGEPSVAWPVPLSAVLSSRYPQ